LDGGNTSSFSPMSPADYLLAESQTLNPEEKNKIME
jgi:hypothetical protein